jgi:predicted component of type VI protein secretion system
VPWLATEGSAHQIGDGETIVGSGPHAAWRLAAHDLAARHFVVQRSGDRVTVCAASVESVVAVNGRQIGTSPVELRDGDTIDAGSTRFAFSKERRAGIAAAPISVAHIVEARSGIAHPLVGPSVGIGRDRANPILVLDPTASRFHAEVRWEAGGWVLHPRGSSGTVVNGRRVGTPERLEDGDKIEIAHVEMKYVVGPPPANAPRPEPLAQDDTDRSQRRTIVQSAVMEVPDVATTTAQRSNLWIFVVLGLVVVGTLYLAFR